MLGQDEREENVKLAEFVKHFPQYVITKPQLYYARYLEQEGLRLLVDFGFENAEGMAWDRLENGCGILGHA